MTQIELSYIKNILTEKSLSRRDMIIFYEIILLHSLNLTIYATLISDRVELSVPNVYNSLLKLEKKGLIKIIQHKECRSCSNVYEKGIPPRCECGCKLLNLEHDFENKLHYPHSIIELTEDLKKDLESNLTLKARSFRC